MKILKEKTVRVTAIPVNPKEVILLEKKSTPSRSYNTYSNSYDVYNYDDPDDFADDWAEEFGGGNYGGGYDDAYDYWEENYGK